MILVDTSIWMDHLAKVPTEKGGPNVEYTAIVKHCGEWWIGWIQEVPGVNCQERTLEELRQSLAEALAEALELNRQEALAAAGPDYIEEKVVLA